MYTKNLPPGWLTESEAELLISHAQESVGDILEVGCYKGRSTVLLASLGRQMHCVDPFSNFDKSDLSGRSIKAAFKENTKHLPNITLYEQPIEKWRVHNCGFAYLDGDHSYVGTISQITAALACNVTHIAVHDVNDKGGGRQVKKACTLLLGAWEIRVGRLAVWTRERQQ